MPGLRPIAAHELATPHSVLMFSDDAEAFGEKWQRMGIPALEHGAWRGDPPRSNGSILGLRDCMSKSMHHCEHRK